MRGYFGLACLLAVLGVFGVTGSARADRYGYDRDYGVRLYGGLGFGFGGDLEIPGPPHELDLGTSIGGQFGVDFVLGRYFALGPEMRITGYNIENSSGRSRFIDLDAKPRLRLPIARYSEIYATVPIGLTFPRFQDDNFPEKVGWNIGIGAGYTHFITHRFGLNLEPIFTWHFFDNDVTAKQFHLLLNAVLAI